MAFEPHLSNLVTMSVDHTPAELPPGLLAEYLESAASQLRVLAELAERLALAGLLEYGLRARGYRFVTFRNGRDALDALLALDVGELHPLLLLDVDLPALDGYSILDTLTRERPGQYRVVFTTVHGDESEQL